MNILIVGSGAREHAIVNLLIRSNPVPQIFCFGASKNPAIFAQAADYAMGKLNDCAAILDFARAHNIDLAIIGPELPLAFGVADALWSAKIKTVGPYQALAQLEASKGFARNLMAKYQIPGLPRYKIFTHLTGVMEYLTELGMNNYVIKDDGLQSGKGVKIGGEHLSSFDDALAFIKQIFARGSSCVIEEKLSGQEFSLMCFCDGATCVPMPVVQDHKRAWCNDEGPNTGGMGSYSAADHSLPFLTAQDVNHALRINRLVLQALAQEIALPYIGILYGSFMATAQGIYVIEFNVRFGDPEALNVLSILQTDGVKLFTALVDGQLDQLTVTFLPQATVCKYVVPCGYPMNSLPTGIDISAVHDKTHLYFAGVEEKENHLFSLGARALAYVGIADTIYAAQQIAESEICQIKGELFHRSDIGTEPAIMARILNMQKLRSSGYM